MTRVGLPDARLLAAVLILLALPGLLIPLNAGAQATTPGAPTIDTITARAGWLLVEWSEPSSDGGSTITAYDARYIETDATDKADGQWTEEEDAWATNGGHRRYALDGLTNDTEYDVQVRAVNAEGDGAWSATVTGTPTLSDATSATIAAVRGDDGAVAVTWNAPTTLVDTAISTTYDLRYIQTDATDKTDDQWTEVVDAGVDDRLLHGITGLTLDTEYDVQVRAVEFAVAGSWSDTATGTPADSGPNLANAREITLATTSSGELDPMGDNYFWGKITDGAIFDGYDYSADWDYFKIVITDEQAPDPVGFLFFTEGSLDSVGRLYDGDGNSITSSGSNSELANTNALVIRRTLEAGTYYIRVRGHDSAIGEYLLRIRTGPDTNDRIYTGTTDPVDPDTLTVGSSVTGLIDPASETDSWDLELTEQTDVIIRSLGTNLTGQLLNEDGAVLAQNVDGNLFPELEGFVIRRLLDAGTYELKVNSDRRRLFGVYDIYVNDAGDPGSTIADAQALNLGLEEAAGGNITSSADVDYFSITVADTTYVQIWAAANNWGTDVDAELVDDMGTTIDANFNNGFPRQYKNRISFAILHRLEAGTHYVKVTGVGGSTGKYTILAVDDFGLTQLEETCKDVPRGGISDAWYGCQWHLQDDGLYGSGSTEDINVEGVWSGGNLGEGITVAVVDDGIHHQHEDLTANVDTAKNHDFANQGGIYHPFETHGTAVAGLIAARDNAIGMRGVAPRATIYGYNYLLSGNLGDEVKAASLHADTTAVNNNSWGSRGSGGGHELVTSLWEEAIETAVTTGYGGKGVFFVWGAGNGALAGGHSSRDERTNFYAVTAACGVDGDGVRTFYSEPGSNLWVCAPASHGRYVYIATTAPNNRYTTSFGGTSAAAPIVSGVAALVRKANNALTWRDVKLILAASARKNDADNDGWEEGADKYGDTGKYNFNHEYGFGVVDAQAAVNLADGWTNLPGLRKSTAQSGEINISIPDATGSIPGTTVTQKLSLDDHVEFIEYIHVVPDTTHPSFVDLEVEVESPSGTVSKLSPHFDKSVYNTATPFSWVSGPLRLGSARHLGESPAGEWTLRLTDHVSGEQGTLESWSITAYGHGTKPAPVPIDEVQPSSGAFTVTWEAPADPGRSAITGYQVHHILSDATDKSDGEWTSATTGESVRQHTASGLDGEAEYDVRVRAVSTLGNGEWSETETVTTGALDAPAIASLFGVDETITVKWTAPADSSLGTITSYDLRHKYTNFDGWYEHDSIWTSTAGGPLEHTLVPTVLLGRGRSHYVQVRAVVGTTEHPWSASRTVIGVPGPPFISSVTADPDGNKLAVRWASAVSVHPYPVTSYDLRYIETSEDETIDANWTVKIDVPDIRGLSTIEGLTNWVSYDVQMRGWNAGGPGPWSATKTGTPSNTDVGLTLEWEDTSVSVNEDGGSVTLKAIVTTDSDEALPSDFSFDATVTTDDDTATDPDDYAPSSGSTLTFDQGDFERVMTSSGYRYQATREYTFTISDDAVDEDDETFTATLAFVDSSNPNFETRNAVATVTIGDDEQVGVTLGWNPATVSVNESSSTVRLTATATTTSDKRPESGFTFDATVVTSPGTADATDDYTHASTTVTFNQADFGAATVDGNRRYRASKSVTVPIVNDTDDERDETFTVTVDYVDSNPAHLQGGSAAATVTIQDNDRPTVSIAAVDTSAAEDDTLEFRLTRVGVPDDALTVNVRVSETGRMLASGQPTTATFSAGSSTATLNIALNDDTDDEDNSTVTVALRSGSGYVLGTDTSDTATALDNDHVPVTLGWAVDPVTVAEGAGQVVLKGVATTTKDKQPESGFSFVAEVTFADGTAGSGDYTGRTQRQTFSQSDFTDSGQRYEATKEFTVNIAGGDGSEDDETFTATLAYVGSDPLPAHLQGGSATVTVTITVIDDNVAPEFDDGTSTTRSVPENSPAGTAVGEPVEATDLNNDSLTYKISSQQGGPYTVDTATGQIRVGDVATLDHERRTTQRVNLKVEDPDGLSDTIQVQIEVANVNEPPVISGNTAVEWRENRTGNVTRYTAADPEQDSVEWTVSGTDAGFFSIDSSGYLTFNNPPDFEASRGNTYEITVVGTDTDSNSGELDVTVTVTNVNEPPTVEGRTSLALSENDEAFDETYSATDPEGSATTFTWSVSGTDGGDFTINRDTGTLTFRNTPDYERPADSNRDNEYLVQVRASDGSLTGALDVTVTVTPVNEPPTITGTETLSYAENSVRAVAAYRATDPEGATITWSVSGVDDDDFNISETGALTFAEIPDFETPDDANQDNEYLVTVEARDDAFNYARLDVTITVTNSTGAEEPTITTTSNPSPYRENGTGAVYTFRARDPQGRAVTWSITGTDSHAFDISSSGALTFASPPDFENPTDADRDNIYEITVVVTDDQGLTDSVDVTITVTNHNEGVEPTISTRSPPSTYRENGTSTVYTFRASDPQRQEITWTLEGNDSGVFNISSAGALVFINRPDFEAPVDSDRQNDYQLTVIATDPDGHVDRLSFTITVTDVNEGPEVTSGGSTFTAQENRTWSGASFTASDPEGGSVTRWSLGGRDSGDFTTTHDSVTNQGRITFRNTPDHERPDDADRDNTYEVEIRPYDGRYYGSHPITITVEDVAEITGPSTLDRAENFDGTLATYAATGVGDLTVNPAWRLTGTDGGDFTITEQGVVSFRATPDHERPADSNRDNIYNFAVQATDGRYYDSHDVTVTVTPVNEPPTITTTSSSATALRQPENRTARLYTYRATDPEGGATITWSVAGADARFFAITERGEFSFEDSSPPDYEIPGDSGRDNVYDVTIEATDDGGNKASLPITVTVTEVNEGPEVTSGRSSYTVAENQDLTNASYTAFDPEGGTVTRWSVGGTDGGDFQIDESGVLTFRTLPDYERPADSNRDNIYQLQVRPYDGRYYGAFDVTVTVTPVNEPPTITTTSSSATTLRQPENRTTRLYAYRATDPEGGATITWSVAGADARFFAITERGEFSFDEISPPDYEIPGDSGRDNVYDVTIEATDDGGNKASLPVTVTVTEVNEGPEVTSGRSSYTVAENQDLTNAAYAAFDPEGGTVTRWSVGGTDGGDFQIDESGVLTFRNLPDYERPADSNRDNIYQLQVRPYDGRYYGSFDVTVTVTPVNEPPTITTTSTSATTMTHPENRTTRLYAYRATDPEGATIVWTAAGVDARFFAINDRGELSFSESDPPDFEARATLGQEHVYHVTVRAGDGTHTASLPVAVTVTDVNEGPVVSGTASFTIPENGSLSGAAYSARDPEGLYVTRWSVGGRDGGDFFITQGGTLYFRSPPDYERPADSNRDNVYELIIQPYDGRNTGSFAVTITVTNVNEPPEFRSGSRASFTQPENRATRLYTYSATDPEGGTVTWSVGGADGGHFTIDERGQFSFDPNNPPDFDAPGDLGGNNTYNVNIEATDPESNTGRLPVTVIVTEVNEGPVITLQGAAPGSVRENHPVTLALARYTASDPERPTVSITQWSTSGPDGGDFVMNALGELRFRYSPDYERPADSNRDNVYEVTIRASDGRNTGAMEEVQVVTVTDVNEPPTITTTSRVAFTQPENRNTVLYTFRATDPEGGTISWTPAGTDGRFFTIDEQGRFSFTNPPDFESPSDAGRDNVYDVTIEARDPESNAASLLVAVTVTNHNEGVQPTISTRRPPTTYQENRTTTVYTFRASDPQRGVIAWSLTGPDAGDFSISESGALTFNNPPDFENPADADRDNVYELTVVATDAEGYTDRVSFTIAVTNHNEGVEPTISTRRPPTTYQENRTTTVYTFSASDPQRQTITWSLDGADRSAFTITTDTSGRGVLAFATPPDFESPADADRDNTYELVVTATDSDGNRDRLDFTITVTDLNEAPSISLVGTATTTVPENYGDTRVLARYTASDPENPGLGIHRWSATGRDAGDFVVSALGELRFRASPDFERPADANRDNVYEVAVRASDGRSYGMLAETLLVTVTNLNEAPVITTRSRTEFTLRENSTSTIYTYRATDQDADDRIRWSVEGTDGDDFAIHDGMLTFRLLPDLEVPADSNRDNVYEAVVVTTDNGGLRDTVPATIAITDQSEGPLIAGTTSFTVVENYDITQALGAYTATDAKDGRRVYPQWSLTGRDGGDFVIDRYSGVLSFRNTPDYDRPADSDRDNLYEVTIRGHDSRAYGYLNVVVTVTNINEGAPVVTGSAARTVRENTTSTIYTYRATDPDLGDTIAWSTGGDDGTHFVITRNSSGQGLLAFAVPPDFENPADLNRDNVYNLDVVATDAAGLRGILAVTVTVTALNEGPVVSGTAEFTVNENRGLSDNQAGSSATYTARDPEAIGGITTTITWSVSGRDGGDFIIDRETGALTFRYLPNYERPADYNRDNVYELIVRAYDGRNYGTFDVTVTVLEVNEGPEITGRDTFTYRENGTAALYTYRATDPEDDSFTWHLGGPDAGDFAITTDSSGRGVLNFASPPNFDVPAGSGAHGNEYLVTVQARDANFNVGELPVTVTVTDLNEGATVSGLQTIAVQENRDPTLVLATYSATDPEGQPITRWSLSGSDGGDFTISADGELTFRYTPDYDRPADSNRDNEYRITVRAYDGRTYGNLDVVITVSNVNEHDPVISSGSRTSFTYREETTSVLYTYRATDGDKDDVITWSTSGTDGNLFEFNDRNGLVFREPPDYEDPQDAGRDNSYDLTVVATDTGRRSAELAVTVTVTAVDEGPEISGTTNYTVLEGQELVGATFTATDPEDPAIVVSNWRTSGTDGGDFTITQDGTLSFRNTPDYDRPADSNRDNVYLVTIQVSDGRYYGSLEVTVTVTDQNESTPVVSGSETLSFRENTASTLYTYRVTDADLGATITWSVRGTDGGDFDINPDGQLTFRNPPDHERPADSNSDNVYEITVVASDGTNEGVLAVTVTVTAVNEGPEISGRDAITVFENHTAILSTYTGTDPEDTSADITRWGTSGRDGGDFTITSDGNLSFRNPPNHERPADSNRDNVYELTIRASDGGVYGYYDVIVTVQPVDEAPEFRSGSRESFTYRENATSTLYTYRATDPEGADVAWSVSGADAGHFAISDTGVLTFGEPPNFENPARFDGTDHDNEYEVSVVATDETNHAASLPVIVTVTDVNEGPEITGCTETELDTVQVVEFEDCNEITVQENHDEPLYSYTARDPEIPDLEITRWITSGRDGGDFTITEDGELSFRYPPDSERPADYDRDGIYEVTVRASDGRYYGAFDVIVTVEAVDEAPEFHSSSRDTFIFRENGTTALHTYRATDPEGSDVTWGLSGQDGADFEISENGVLEFLNAPDYERPADSNRDNIYEVTVEATDENSNTRQLEVTVTVVNLTD